MSSQQFRPGVTTFRRFAKRDTNPRKWTFVREWENESSSPKNRIVTQVNKNAVVITSPVPQFHSPGSESDRSLSDIVSQYQIPVVISAQDPPHQSADSDEENDPEENLPILSSRRQSHLNDSKHSQRQSYLDMSHGSHTQSHLDKSPLSNRQSHESRLSQHQSHLEKSPHSNKRSHESRFSQHQSHLDKSPHSSRHQESRFSLHQSHQDKSPHLSRSQESRYSKHQSPLDNSHSYLSKSKHLRRKGQLDDTRRSQDLSHVDESQHFEHLNHVADSQQLSHVTDLQDSQILSQVSGNSSTMATDGDMMDMTESENTDEQEDIVESRRSTQRTLSTKAQEQNDQIKHDSISTRKVLREVKVDDVATDNRDPVAMGSFVDMGKRGQAVISDKRRKLSKHSTTDENHHDPISVMTPTTNVKKGPSKVLDSNITETPTSRKSPDQSSSQKEKLTRKRRASPVQTITQWMGHEQTRTKSSVLDLDIVLDCVTTTINTSWKKTASREEQKALKRLLKHVTTQITETIDKIESLKTARSENAKVKSEIKYLRRDLLELQQRKIRLSNNVTETEKQSRKQSISKWMFGFQKFLRSFGKY